MMHLSIQIKPKSYSVLSNNLLTSAGVWQDLHFSVQLSSAILYNHSHPSLLHLYLQAEQMRWYLTIDILIKT